MSIEVVALKYPELADQIKRFVNIMDDKGDLTADIVLYAPRYKEAMRCGLKFMGGHKIVKGPPTHRRPKRPQEVQLLE